MKQLHPWRITASSSEDPIWSWNPSWAWFWTTSVASAVNYTAQNARSSQILWAVPGYETSTKTFQMKMPWTFLLFSSVRIILICSGKNPSHDMLTEPCSFHLFTNIIAFCLKFCTKWPPFSESNWRASLWWMLSGEENSFGFLFRGATYIPYIRAQIERPAIQASSNWAWILNFT